MGGKTLDQFHAKQKSKAQKESKTGTTPNQKSNTEKREYKHDL